MVEWNYLSSQASSAQSSGASKVVMNHSLNKINDDYESDDEAPPVTFGPPRMRSRLIRIRRPFRRVEDDRDSQADDENLGSLEGSEDTLREKAPLPHKETASTRGILRAIFGAEKKGRIDHDEITPDDAVFKANNDKPEIAEKEEGKESVTDVNITTENDEADDDESVPSRHVRWEMDAIADCKSVTGERLEILSKPKSVLKNSDCCKLEACAEETVSEEPTTGAPDAHTGTETNSDPSPGCDSHFPDKDEVCDNFNGTTHEQKSIEIGPTCVDNVARGSDFRDQHNKVSLEGNNFKSISFEEAIPPEHISTKTVERKLDSRVESSKPSAEESKAKEIESEKLMFENSNCNSKELERKVVRTEDSSVLSGDTADRFLQARTNKTSKAKVEERRNRKGRTSYVDTKYYEMLDKMTPSCMACNSDTTESDTSNSSKKRENGSGDDDDSVVDKRVESKLITPEPCLRPEKRPSNFLQSLGQEISELGEDIKFTFSHEESIEEVDPRGLCGFFGFFQTSRV